MSYSASVIDFYDDNGSALRSTVPDLSGLPDFVKTASTVTQEDPGNMFALVMVENGQTLKKYATADAGNTWISALYFSLNRDKLPVEAQKLAAANLRAACEHFGIEAPSIIEELGSDLVETNVVDITGRQPPIKKVASEDTEFAIERADGSKHYPLSSAGAVKAANEYFGQYHGHFTPRERREYSVKVAAASEKIGLSVNEEILKYSGIGYSRGIEGHMAVRQHHLVAMDCSPEIREVLTKLASARKGLEPTQFAEHLSRLDEITGLDRLWDTAIADPWYATFNMVKEAKGAGSAPRTFVAGLERVTEDDLQALTGDLQMLRDHFGDGFAKGFAKDPVTLFESMPLPQKKLIARLAADVRGNG
jgi:hypothetical protein